MGWKFSKILLKLDICFLQLHSQRRIREARPDMFVWIQLICFYHLCCLNVEIFGKCKMGNLGATSVDEEILCKVREDVCYVRYVSDDLSCEIVV